MKSIRKHNSNGSPAFKIYFSPEMAELLDLLTNGEITMAETVMRRIIWEEIGSEIEGFTDSAFRNGCSIDKEDLMDRVLRKLDITGFMQTYRFQLNPDSAFQGGPDIEYEIGIKSFATDYWTLLDNAHEVLVRETESITGLDVSYLDIGGDFWECCWPDAA